MWKRRPPLYYLALAALVVNAILSLTGLWDALVLFVDVVTLALLVAARSWFTRRG